MTIWTDTKRAADGSVVLAAITLGRGLMAGDPANFKRGYSAENAYLAVVDLAEADGDDFTTAEENTIKLALADGRSASEVAAAWEEGNQPEPDPADEVEA